MRLKPPEGRIIYFYVLDRQGHLRGVGPRGAVAQSARQAGIRDHGSRGDRGAAVGHGFGCLRVLRDAPFSAFPVVDADRRMTGVIDVEMYTAELGDIDRSDATTSCFSSSACISTRLTRVRR